MFYFTCERSLKSSQTELHQKVATSAGREIRHFTTAMQTQECDGPDSGRGEQLKMKRNEAAFK